MAGPTTSADAPFPSPAQPTLDLPSLKRAFAGCTGGEGVDAGQLDTLITSLYVRPP